MGCGEIRSHRDLIVWQKAMDMAAYIFELGDRLPQKELYGLRSQLTRAAASVPANIAEGNARGTAKDYSRFLAIAKGSLVEAETYLLLAVRLDYFAQETVDSTLSIITEIDKMLTAMRIRLDKA